MADSKKPIAGKVLSPNGRQLGVLKQVDGFAALNQLVGAARECIIIRSTERTEQKRIDAYETVEIARIKAAEGVLRQYFEGTFADRRATIDAFFVRLNQALDAGNAQAIHEVVSGIVDIAKSSPLANLGDLGQIRAALDDPDQVWDL